MSGVVEKVKAKVDQVLHKDKSTSMCFTMSQLSNANNSKLTLPTPHTPPAPTLVHTPPVLDWLVATTPLARMPEVV
jgi:hypothetical protein